MRLHLLEVLSASAAVAEKAVGGVTRRRVRYCPPVRRRRPSWCATVAALSAELGSLEAAFERLDQERAAKVALGAARYRRVQDALVARQS